MVSRYFSNWRKVWRDRTIPPLAKVLLKDLEEYQSSEHFAWPSQQTLAKNHGVLPKTIRKHLKILESKMLLSIKQRGYKNTNKMRLSSTLFYPSLRSAKDTSNKVKKVSQSLPIESTQENNKQFSFKKNPILEDPDFQRWLKIDKTTDSGHRMANNLLDLLDKRYPDWKHGEAWAEARKVISNYHGSNYVS